jgi:hypothetical protein
MEGFIDAQARHEETPDTFHVMHIEDLRATVVVGDMVKVCHSDERFWVQVTERKDDRIAGTVANDLFRAPFDYGDLVQFELRHIYDHIDKDFGWETNDEDDNVESLHDICNAPGRNREPHLH